MRQLILLRGINVGGNNKLPMADLKMCLELHGYTNVQSYIQSGNVAVDSNQRVKEVDIQKLLEAEFQLSVPVVVRSARQVARAISDNPFPDAEPKKLHVLFLSKSVSEAQAASLDSEKFLPDVFACVKTHAYVKYEENSWSSKLTIEVFEKAFSLTATARNWNTTRKLAQLVE